MWDKREEFFNQVQRTQSSIQNKQPKLKLRQAPHRTHTLFRPHPRHYADTTTPEQRSTPQYHRTILHIQRVYKKQSLKWRTHYIPPTRSLMLCSHPTNRHPPTPSPPPAERSHRQTITPSQIKPTTRSARKALRWFIQITEQTIRTYTINQEIQVTPDCGYTGCFTTLGHNCRRWFPRSLW